MKLIYTTGLLLIFSLSLGAQGLKGASQTQGLWDRTSEGLATDSLTTFQELEVFPNPVQEELSIQFQLSSPTPVRIQLFNLIGKQLLALSIDPTQGFVEQSLDMRPYPSGVYILRLESPKETSVSRLSKK